MTSDEWKKELTNRCDNVFEEYKKMYKHLDSADTLGEDVDLDDISAFVMLKLSGLEKKIQNHTMGLLQQKKEKYNE